jgi:nucleotide-binding universal stress UspA family protein
MTDIRRILVPTDFTETSNHALEWAIGIAAPFRAKVTVMHAYEIPVVGFPDGAIIATPDLAARISESSQTALDKLVDNWRTAGTSIDAILREGIIYEEINAVADEISASLIVIGTHGRRGLARALLGSVAENVIRTANRPVVTIRDAHAH